MPSQITITAKIGPGDTISSLVINPANFANFNFLNKTVTINGQSYDLAGATTFTMTYSAPNYTLTIS